MVSGGEEVLQMSHEVKTSKEVGGRAQEDYRVLPNSIFGHREPGHPISLDDTFSQAADQ